MDATFSIAVAPGAQCPICQDPLADRPTPLAAASDMNVYCQECITRWIEANETATSPLTRRVLTRELFLEREGQRNFGNGVVFDKARVLTVAAKVEPANDAHEMRILVAHSRLLDAWKNLLGYLQASCFPRDSALNPFQRYRYTIQKMLARVVVHAPLTCLAQVNELVSTLRSYTTRLFDSSDDLFSFDKSQDFLDAFRALTNQIDGPLANFYHHETTRFLENNDAVMLSREDMGWMSTTHPDFYGPRRALEKAQDVTRAVLNSGAVHRQRLYAEYGLMKVGPIESLDPRVLRRLQFIVMAREIGPISVSSVLLDEVEVESTWRSRLGRLMAGM